MGDSTVQEIQAWLLFYQFNSKLEQLGHNQADTHKQTEKEKKTGGWWLNVGLLKFTNGLLLGLTTNFQKHYKSKLL